MKSRFFIFIIVCAFALTGCGLKENENEETKTVFAMDTVMDLKAYGKNAAAALDAAENEIKRLDNALSRGAEGSEVYNLNASGSAQVSDETAALISEALDISEKTGGAFDITVAPVMDLWGFFTKNFRVPSQEELAEAIKRVGYEYVSVDNGTVTLSNGAQIDLGGIAKGYLSGRIMDIFASHGVTSAIVSLGGNVHAIGKKPDGTDWKVAIQNPNGGYIGTVTVSDKAVITSGSYQRYFEQDGKIYHHIIDPKTGMSADNGLKSVTIITDNSTLADGLSTALYVMGYENAASFCQMHSGFDAVLMTDTGRVYITDGIKDIWNSELPFDVIS